MRRLITLLLLVGVATEPASAQGLFGKLKQKAKEKAAQKADQATTAIVDTASGMAEHAVRCGVNDKLCMKNAQAAGQPVVVTNGSGQPVSSKDSAAAIASATAGATPPPSASGATPSSSSAAMKPGEGAWANYDFVPGDRTIFYADFSADVVGDFPRRLDFKEGILEVVDWQGARYLRSTDQYSKLEIPLPEALPERFTIEFDYAGGTAYYNGVDLSFANGPDLSYVQFGADESGVYGGGIKGYGGPDVNLRDQLIHARLMVDGRYAKVYLNEKRVANVPNANLGRSNKISVKIEGSKERPTLITNLRIAAGGRKLYDALAEKGRVSTQGIYFDTGSDRIRPESSPTLKEIGGMLKEHAELNLVIEGHTDNVGKPDANQGLSERRANAVRQFLLDSYGIDGARLQAKGLGQTKPVASNDSPEGRQSNRRVELVKM